MSTINDPLRGAPVARPPLRRQLREMYDQLHVRVTDPVHNPYQHFEQVMYAGLLIAIGVLIGSSTNDPTGHLMASMAAGLLLAAATAAFLYGLAYSFVHLYQAIRAGLRAEVQVEPARPYEPTYVSDEEAVGLGRQR